MSGRNHTNSGFNNEARCDELIASVLRGDATARCELLDLYRDRLRRLVALRLDARLAQRVDASDIVQDVTLAASERLDDYLSNPTMDFYVWLRWMTRDRMIDVHREHLGTLKRDASREISVDSGHDRSTTGLAEALAGELTSPSNAVERDQNRQAVRDAISQLDVDDREILLLRHFEQLSTSQSAAVLGMSKSGAAKRHVHALRRLQSILNKTLPDYA